MDCTGVFFLHIFLIIQKIVKRGDSKTYLEYLTLFDTCYVTISSRMFFSLDLQPHRTLSLDLVHCSCIFTATLQSITVAFKLLTQVRRIGCSLASESLTTNLATTPIEHRHAITDGDRNCWSFSIYSPSPNRVQYDYMIVACFKLPHHQ